MRISNSISELRQQIYHDLLIQHPDWVEPNGECPKCDAYVARLMEELSIAEGNSEALGGWAYRDPNRLDRRATNIRQLRKGLKRSVK
jgi:hypothetical protein